MRSLYLRIYATVVVVLMLFAFASGWLFQRGIEQERGRAETMFAERMSAWGDLIRNSIPAADAPRNGQAVAIEEWSFRLRLPLALDDADGARIGASDSFVRREVEGQRAFPIHLEDGRTLWVMRPFRGGPRREDGMRAEGGEPMPEGAGPRDGRLEANPFGRGPGGFGAGMPRGAGERFARGAPEAPPLVPWLPPSWQRGLGLVVLLAILFVAVAAGAYPVVRRLTRRLEVLKRGVEKFGAGQLSHRVDASGKDEVAAVAKSFNEAAARVESLVQSHRTLLANASHELRSPLARLRMAVSMMEDAPPAQRARLKREVETNVAELDALVEEVLLASRLDARAHELHREPIDALALAAEEAARVQASVEGPGAALVGDERLVRRALRNLLENARRYGGGEIVVQVAPRGGGGAVFRVCDRGPGVPEAMRDRIFEPFFRLPGHAEREGGVGLGLSLVKQIAERHGGSARCETREGGGSCFVIELPAGSSAAPRADPGMRPVPQPS
jgi:signal transduction histidine kinase